jgi:hypothetical protein
LYCAPLARAQYNQIGVQLPEKARSVKLTFDDRAYERGKVITLVTIAIALLLAAAGIVLDRRRAASVSPVSAA